MSSAVDRMRRPGKSRFKSNAIEVAMTMIANTERTVNDSVRQTAAQKSGSRKIARKLPSPTNESLARVRRMSKRLVQSEFTTGKTATANNTASIGKSNS